MRCRRRFKKKEKKYLTKCRLNQKRSATKLGDWPRRAHKWCHLQVINAPNGAGVIGFYEPQTCSFPLGWSCNNTAKPGDKQTSFTHPSNQFPQQGKASHNQTTVCHSARASLWLWCSFVDLWQQLCVFCQMCDPCSKEGFFPLPFCTSKPPPLTQLASIKRAL